MRCAAPGRAFDRPRVRRRRLDGAWMTFSDSGCAVAKLQRQHRDRGSRSTGGRTRPRRRSHVIMPGRSAPAMFPRSRKARGEFAVAGEPRRPT